MSEENDIYYYKVLKNMNLQEKLKNSKIRKHECFLEDISDRYLLCEDEYFKENWTEQIENSDLYIALKGLNAESQRLIELLFVKEFTQCEIAEQFGTTRQNISKKIQYIIRKMKISV